MGAHIPPDEGVARDLRNEETEKKLGFIKELRDLGVSKYIDLPQLVVVGDQSSGKSSVLQAITKLPFPVDDRMCTRFATEVILERSDEPLSTSISLEVRDGDTQILPEAFQQEVARWRPRSFDPADNLDGPTFAKIIKEATEFLLGNSRNNHTLSAITLRLVRRGPEENNFSIVDIPGLVSVGHEAHRTARYLVEEYVKNPKSIILAVAHPADPGTQEIFQMLKRIEDKENRVIGVITKCDRKQEGAEDWILDTIKNTRTRSNENFLNQGWFGLRNRLPTEKNISDDERDVREAAFFSHGIWTDLDQPSKLGIKHLKKALVKMLDSHLTKSIPTLVPEIEAKLRDCKTKLNHLGIPRSLPTEQLSCMVHIASEFSRLASYALDGQYDRLPAGPMSKVRKNVHSALEVFCDQMQHDFTEEFGRTSPHFLLESTRKDLWEDHILRDELLKEIDDTIRDNRGRESPGEVNPCVLRLLWTRKTERWIESAKKAVDDLVTCVGAAVAIFFEAVCQEADLRTKTQNWLRVHLRTVSENAQKELETIVSDERNGLVWTLNPQRLDGQQELEQHRLNSMAQNLVSLNESRRDPVELSEKSNFDERMAYWTKQIKLWLSSHKNITAIFETHDRLASYYGVAMYRFIDNVGHQVIERHLLGPSSPLRIFTPEYVVQEFQDNPVLLNTIAGENEDIVTERQGLVAEERSLKEALDAAREYGY